MIEENKRLSYEAVKQYLWYWHNPHQEPGQYDGNGLVHLILAALENLARNRDSADLPSIRESMTDAQAEFFLTLADYIRGPRHQKIATRWPTFGEACDYLRRLQYTSHVVERGGICFRHPTEESWFVFRDRDPSTPARPTELMDMRTQLTWRGFVTEAEFSEFWHNGLHAPPLEAFR